MSISGKMKSPCLENSLLNIKRLREDPPIGEIVIVQGWVKSARGQKTISFIELTDGSCFASLQIVLNRPLPENLTTGCSIRAYGKIVESPAKGQSFEMQSTKIDIIGECPPDDYPLQKKRHSFEFLRTIAHLRSRTNTQGAVARVRSRLAYATHRFFQERDFLYLQSPIITASDCEGAGELFRVSTSAPDEFFGKPAFLTVSGQLNAEAYACGLSKAYTFGPTFRAENSHTSRHIAEFWMVEPEMAFCDLEGNMQLAEAFIKDLVKEALNHCEEDLAFFDQFIEKGLIERLKPILSQRFECMTYTQAIAILKKSKKSFEYPVEWGTDLQSEHERFLCEEHCKKPIILYDYPKALKAFYMRDNDDGKTVAAMDVLVPGVGEIIGGSQREERLSVLENKIQAAGLPLDNYQWYLDLRRFGTVAHSGFGLGFERLISYITGLENIRDAIAFPRAPNLCEF